MVLSMMLRFPSYNEMYGTGGRERSVGSGTMTHIQMFLVLLHALAEPSFEKQNGQRYKVNPNDAKRAIST